MDSILCFFFGCVPRRCKYIAVSIFGLGSPISNYLPERGVTHSLLHYNFIVAKKQRRARLVSGIKMPIIQHFIFCSLS